MSNLNTVFATAADVFATVSKNASEATLADITKAFNDLAKVAKEGKEVKKFPSKPKAIERLEDLLEKVEPQLKAEPAKETKAKAEPKKAAAKAEPAKETKAEAKKPATKAKAEPAKEVKPKKERKGRVSLLVTIVNENGEKQEPTKMNLIRISIFKASKKIILSRAPSEPQRKHLENMGVLDRMVIEEATA